MRIKQIRDNRWRDCTEALPAVLTRYDKSRFGFSRQRHSGGQAGEPKRLENAGGGPADLLLTGLNSHCPVGIEDHDVAWAHAADDRRLGACGSELIALALIGLVITAKFVLRQGHRLLCAPAFCSPSKKNNFTAFCVRRRRLLYRKNDAGLCRPEKNDPCYLLSAFEN